MATSEKARLTCRQPKSKLVYIMSYQCDTCDTVVRTRQGLQGHKRFRHGEQIGNVRASRNREIEAHENMIALMRLMTVDQLRMSNTLGKMRDSLMKIETRLRRLG